MGSLVCECGVCEVCRSRERQRAYRTDPVMLERVRASDRRRSRKPKRMAANTSKTKEHRQRNPQRYAARTAVGNALRDGRIEKGPCEFAGADCGGPVQAHHEDYGKPLDVRWLCREHHWAEHRAFL